MIDIYMPEPDISVSFPVVVSSISDPKLLLDGVDQFLFPEDVTRLKYMGTTKVLDWGISNSFYKELMSSAQNVRDFKESNSSLRRENDSQKLFEARAKMVEHESLASIEELA
ncbi:hypothetical protein ACOSQ3_002844 [Xanthoceras sorbifolium]